MSIVVFSNIVDHQPTMSDSETEFLKKGFKWHRDVQSGLKQLAKHSTSEPEVNFMMMRIDPKEEEILLIDRVKDVRPAKLVENIIMNANDEPCHIFYAHPDLQTSQEQDRQLLLIYICPEKSTVHQKMLYSLNLVNLTKIVNAYNGTHIWKRIEVRSAQDLDFN